MMKPVLLWPSQRGNGNHQASAPCSRANFTFLLGSVELNKLGKRQAAWDWIRFIAMQCGLVYAYQPRSQKAACGACCLIKSAFEHQAGWVWASQVRQRPMLIEAFGAGDPDLASDAADSCLSVSSPAPAGCCRWRRADPPAAAASGQGTLRRRLTAAPTRTI